MKQIGFGLIPRALPFVLAGCLLILFSAGCKKSFNNRFNRITGKWKLVEFIGPERLLPETDQYMEFFEEEISDGVYKAHFTNFQETYSTVDTLGESLFTRDGTWQFLLPGPWGGSCNYEMEIEEFEGLRLQMNSGLDTTILESWIIEQLSQNKLVLNNFPECPWSSSDLHEESRQLKFEKIE